MALVIADRVKETTTTTGTSNLNLAGAVSGFQGFVAAGITDTTYYALIDANGTAWEVGLGTINDGDPDTLTRTDENVIASTNSNNRISLSSGTHTVFATYAAGKAVYLDASGNLSHTVDISSDTNLVGGTGITLTGDTLSTTDSEIVHDNLSGFVPNEHIDWTTDQGSTNIHAGNYTDTNTMGSGFTVSATTDTTATTITEGEDLFFAAGTGITCETTADGTVTISCTVTDTNTQLSQEQVEDYVNGLLTAGSNVSLTYDDAAGTLTVAATDTNTMGSGFTVSATTDSNATTITQGDDLMFAAGTGITCETTADGTVTISCTVTDTNTQLSQEQVEDYVDGLLTAGSNISLTYDDAAGTLTIAATDTNTMGSGFTVSATTDSNATTITQGDDLMFAAGTGITCETTADGTVTISCTVTDTNTQLSEEQVEDFVGGMVTGNTETGISVTYQDADGTLDFAVSDTTVAGDSGSTDITPGDTLTIAGGTNATTAMSGDTLTVNVDDAFLKNDADDTTSGKITAAGYAISAVVTESGTSRTLADSDNGKVIVCTNGSATTITVPASLATGFAVTVIQTGSGQVTFSASSTTINNRQSHTKTAGQHARVGLVQTSQSPDTYNLGGDTAS